MAKYEITELQPKPEFDMWMYAELSGETRIDHELMEEFEPRWNEWLGKLNAWQIKNVEGKSGFLLVCLDKDVDEDIDHIWNDSPTFGLSFHNLAVCMVMSAARSLVPELEEGRCAPLPRAGSGLKDALKEYGIEWVTETNINRKYAVFTPYPYNGGCEICYMSDSCPNSTVKKQ